MGIRRREHPRLRYYLYISDSKLDMLYEQIEPRALRHLSAELKVDLKVASVILKHADNPERTRAAKLRIVERFLDRHHQVGTLDDPAGDYFRGRMQMAWGFLRTRDDALHGKTPAVLERDESPLGMAMFHGTHNGCAVGLLGSGGHVLSRTGIAEPTMMAKYDSRFPSIFRALEEHIANAPEMTDWLDTDKYRHPRRYSSPRAHGWEAALHHPLFDDPPQLLEFLAVPLARNENAVLGTPLYVALAATDERDSD